MRPERPERRTLYDTFLSLAFALTCVDFDKTDSGEAHRCALLAIYGELVCESCWHSGPRLTEQLNDLSRSSYGTPFCARSSWPPTLW